MKETANLVLILVTILTLLSCNNPNSIITNETKVVEYTKLNQVSWLIGKWERNSSEGNATEIWEKVNDSTFAGISFIINGKDTVSSETIKMIQEGKKIYYIPTVKEQNDGNPIRFFLTTLTANQYVFENPSHDFPQKITYTQITNDSLLAEVSGIMDGKQISQEFPMVRAK